MHYRQISPPAGQPNLKNAILAKARTKHLRDFLNYLQEYSQMPNCMVSIGRYFQCRRFRSVGPEVRTAFESLDIEERRGFYAKILQICSSVIEKKIPLPTSATQLQSPLPKQTVQVLIRGTKGGVWQRQVFWMDYQSRKMEGEKYSIYLRDYLFKSTKDNYLIIANLLPLAPGLPLLQVPCHLELFQRVEEASNGALLERIVDMIEGGGKERGDTQSEEDAQSDRPSISEKLSERVRLAREEGCFGKINLEEYLTCRHPVEAGSTEHCRLLVPGGDIHYFFEGEYCLGGKGELVVCNGEKLQAQSSVIKYMIKRLLAGAKVFNISLPVQVFGTESNLSLLLGSFRYAPLLLTGASLLSPLQRFKQVIKFSLTCPACYIRCDKPFNPILGETFQRTAGGALFYGEQVSHHPPVSAALVKGRDFTIYGSFEAEVQFGFNSAVGNNRGWVKVSFDQSDLQRQVVRFTNSPGEMGGLIFGKRTLSLIESVFFVDEENYLFCELFYGKVKLQPKVDARRDSIEGRIVQLRRSADLSRPEEIGEKDVEKCHGLVRGEWLSCVYFNNQLLLDTRREHPPAIEDYKGVLPSDYSLREDIILKRCGAIEECQAAKQRIQQCQRRDRKLRESFL